MKAKTLRTRKEKNLFVVCMILSIIAWLMVLVSILGVFYGLFFGMIVFMAHALMIAYIRGNGVKLSAEQLPDIYAKVVAAAERFELPKIPDAYVMQAGGALNAFATKFIGRNFIVVYADLLEACSEEGKEADMIIGHEVGHLALGHLKWLFFLTPARILPWLGAAYSRACEYSCDRCGFEMTGELKGACTGLAILAAGGKLARRMNLKAFVAQVRELSGFWSSIYELTASHPYLAKRVAALINWKKPGTVQIPRRNLLAYPLAPFLGFGGGGAAAAPMMMVAVIGIMAAIAIPQFEKYRARAEAAASLSSGIANPAAAVGAAVQEQAMDLILNEGYRMAQDFSATNGKWPCSIEELGSRQIVQMADSNGWRMDVNCEKNYIALLYSQSGSTRYRALMLDSGDIESGMME
jgi:Zn-dependent protease with chaperone function